MDVDEAWQQMAVCGAQPGQQALGGQVGFRADAGDAAFAYPDGEALSPLVATGIEEARADDGVVGVAGG